VRFGDTSKILVSTPYPYNGSGDCNNDNEYSDDCKASGKGSGFYKLESIGQMLDSMMQMLDSMI